MRIGIFLLWENTVPYFHSKEDYILWQLADENQDSYLYYKFFPSYKEKKIGYWKTIPSDNPPVAHSPQKHLHFYVPFQVKMVPKKNTDSKEKPKQQNRITN